MKPQYRLFTANNRIVPLDNNISVFAVTVRTDATVEVCLENVQQAGESAFFPAPVWVTMVGTTGANVLTPVPGPVSALRFTGGTFATILQQGIQ